MHIYNKGNIVISIAGWGGARIYQNRSTLAFQTKKIASPYPCFSKKKKKPLHSERIGSELSDDLSFAIPKIHPKEDNERPFVFVQDQVSKTFVTNFPNQIQKNCCSIHLDKTGEGLFVFTQDQIYLNTLVTNSFKLKLSFDLA